ncbi:hypothetical protein FB45DRAFT_822761 [Roridomyces roridus]|uniref:Uncharacterized protein n=1 Tax=Roridomyces roridus TaxID=1738132 RepID=A0AAD7CFX3_9AGAR|nr:hypothetical protein FB45DRAFT_822761 [Roridomyces roridus]
MSAVSRYRDSLTALSARTRTPLSSLVVSFAILHEVTAIVPLVAGFYAARAAGLGERAVAALPSASEQDGWALKKTRGWVADGEDWAARVGRRYGVFGFTKGSKADPTTMVSERIAGDVANAVVAYVATKALLPVRIAAALYLSPAFSRRLVEPTRQVFARILRRTPK